MAVLYKPGREPENIKKRLNNLFSKLDDAYPDKVIVGLQAYHDSWNDTVVELYKLLGYADKDSFLSAYGYTVERLKGGRRKEFNSEDVIKEFQRRYPNGSGFLKLDDLFAANPDLAAKKKTMMNTANDVFGMPLAKYLKEIGILKKIDETLDEKIDELKRRYSDGRSLPRSIDQLKEENADIPSISNIGPLILKKYPGVSVIEYLQQQGLIRVASNLCSIKLPGLKQLFYALSASKGIHEGDYIEFAIGVAQLSVIGQVIKIQDYAEDIVDIPEENLPVVKTSVGVTRYNNELLHSVLSVNAVGTVGELLDDQNIRLNDIEKKAVNNRVIDGKKITAACCRGLATDIVKVMEYLVSKDTQTYSYADIVMMEKGVAEVMIFCEDAREILMQYPNLKMAMFIENEVEKKVSLGYSRSGSAGVTDFYVIGTYNPSDAKRWSMTHSPLEKNFKIPGGNKAEYEFKYREDWLELNFAVDINGKKMVMGGNNL